VVQEGSPTVAFPPRVWRPSPRVLEPAISLSAGGWWAEIASPLTVFACFVYAGRPDTLGIHGGGAEVALE